VKDFYDDGVSTNGNDAFEFDTRETVVMTKMEVNRRWH